MNPLKSMTFRSACALAAAVAAAGALGAAERWKPYDRRCTERQNVFEFTGKPSVKLVAKDKHEVSFAVKGYCDVAVDIVDEKGTVARHLGAGVLGTNAPAPFQKDSLSQKIYWNGKDDLDVYVKGPGKMRVRVRLGLKPVFDRHLGGSSFHNLPGRVFGMVADSTGMYVMTLGPRRKLYLRKFDLDGKYLYSFGAPSADLPESKLTGRAYVEYEPGKRAVHAPNVNQTTADHGHYLPILGKHVENLQPVIADGKLFFLTDGDKAPSKIYHIHTDGSSDVQGMQGRPFAPQWSHYAPRLAASPDGTWIYMTGCREIKQGAHAVFRFTVDGKGPAEPFLGDPNKPGVGKGQFNDPQGIACDRQGRLYVCDRSNNRVQVFDSGGTHVKTISIQRPHFVCVHAKTGAIYVQHDARVRGATRRRTVKLASLDDPREVAWIDGPHEKIGGRTKVPVEGPYGPMALDSWSPKPRLWFAGGTAHAVASLSSNAWGKHVVTVWEEQGKSFRKILDFEERAKEEDGKLYGGRWTGNALGGRVVCDPTRERAYFSTGKICDMRRSFDLETGRPLGGFSFRSMDGERMGGKVPRSYDDIAFDKHGYLHAHMNPNSVSGVVRVDPARPQPAHADTSEAWKHVATYPEVPYDYGVPGPQKAWQGMIPTMDQPGAKWFQDGFGVNMRGDVAEECNIYYVPKMDDVGTLAFEGSEQDRGNRVCSAGSRPTYANYLKNIRDLEKKGIQTVFVPRRPGLPLTGGTVWTFDRTGELRRKFAVITGNLINGVQIDEDGDLYFVTNRPRIMDPEKGYFLCGRTGVYGVPQAKKVANPFTGTLMKTSGGALRILCTKDRTSVVKMEPLPNRPPDVMSTWYPHDTGKGNWAWVEGAEWLYAGASPIVFHQPCSCPTQRSHLDWYKRTYVPESYRHSIGIVDTAGNLIMHLGRYGNHTDALKMKPGTEDIVYTFVRFVSGTDNYLVFEDNGERLTALKLDYRAEEAAAIGTP